MMDQITYVIHQLHYYIYLVYNFQLTIINECKVIHKQPTIMTQILSFLTIFDSISRLTSIRLEFEPNFIFDPSTTYYIYLVYNFQLAIMNESKVLHKQPPIRTQILSFLTILTVFPD